MNDSITLDIDKNAIMSGFGFFHDDNDRNDLLIVCMTTETGENSKLVTTVKLKPWLDISVSNPYEICLFITPEISDLKRLLKTWYEGGNIKISQDLTEVVDKLFPLKMKMDYKTGVLELVDPEPEEE